MSIVRMVKCPICRKTVSFENNPYRPFCSQRCRIIDLGNWASQEYKLEGSKEETVYPDSEESEK